MLNKLQSQQCSSDDKLKVLEMLQRVEQTEIDDEQEILDSDDDEDETDLAERLAGADLNNADEIWNRLTDAEREEFKTIVHNGEIDKIVTPIEAFWKQKITERVIEVEESEKRIKEIRDNCPVIMANIKNFHQITTKPPAKCVIYNLANVIATYSFIYRLYNGDHHNYELEATDIFLSICDNLKANVNFENASAAIDSIVFNSHNVNLHTDAETKAILSEDLQDIFDGPDDEHSKMYLLASLSDIINLFEAAKTTWKRNKTKKTRSESTSFSALFPSYDERSENFKELHNQTHLLGCQKKLEFYLSFCQYCYNKADWCLEF